MINPKKRVYDVYLVSVGKDARIDMNLSRSDNLKRAILENKIEILTRILVQLTSKRDEFREIITDEVIPGCIVYNDWVSRFYKKDKLSNNKIDSYDFIRPVYFSVPSIYPLYRNEVYDKRMVRAYSDRVDEYLCKHDNKVKYFDELSSFFEEAKKNYYMALESYSSSDCKIKRLSRGEK